MTFSGLQRVAIHLNVRLLLRTDVVLENGGHYSSVSTKIVIKRTLLKNSLL